MAKEFTAHVGEDIRDDVDDIDIQVGRLRDALQKKAELTTKQGCAPGVAEVIEDICELICVEAEQLANRAGEEDKAHQERMFGGMNVLRRNGTTVSTGTRGRAGAAAVA